MLRLVSYHPDMYELVLQCAACGEVAMPRDGRVLADRALGRRTAYYHWACVPRDDRPPITPAILGQERAWATHPERYTA